MPRTADKTPELYDVLCAYGTALVGQAAVSDKWSVVSERMALSQPAMEAYQRAMNIFAGPTILKDMLCELYYLQSAGCEGLEPVIELLERHNTKTADEGQHLLATTR